MQGSRWLLQQRRCCFVLRLQARQWALARVWLVCLRRVCLALGRRVRRVRRVRRLAVRLLERLYPLPLSLLLHRRWLFQARPTSCLG